MKNGPQGYIKCLLFVLLVTGKLCHSSLIKNEGEKIYLLKSKAVFFLHISPTCYRGDITTYLFLMLSLDLCFNNTVLKESLFR